MQHLVAQRREVGLRQSGCHGRRSLVALVIVVVDDCGGIGVVVLYSAYVNLLEGVARTRIACYLEFHNAFFCMLYNIEIQCET